MHGRAHNDAIQQSLQGRGERGERDMTSTRIPTTASIISISIRTYPIVSPDEIMSCMLSRVGQNGDAIRDGVKTVFVSEMDVLTALLFAKLSREFLHRAKSGYKLPSAQNNHQVGQHNVVLGTLDAVRYADTKD